MKYYDFEIIRQSVGHIDGYKSHHVDIKLYSAVACHESECPRENTFIKERRMTQSLE